MKIRVVPAMLLAMTWALAACVSGSTIPQGAAVEPEEAAELNLQLGIGYLRQGDWQRIEEHRLCRGGREPGFQA